MQGLHIVRDLKYERVGVAWERGIAFSVCNITLRVPFGFQKSIKLVVFDVDYDFFAAFSVLPLTFFNKTADGTHGLTGHTRHTD